MTRIVSTHRLLLLAAVLAMAFSMLTAAPAHAQTTWDCTVQGTATLNGGFNATNASGSFSGSAHCVSSSGGTVVGGSASATFQYSNTAVLGDATGTLTISGVGSCGFSWVRVGVSAVVTFSGACSGTAVAAFAPTSSTDAVPATAAVVGNGVVTV